MSDTTDDPAGTPMHNPPRPGEVLRELYLAPLGLNVTETAAQLGVSRTALSQLLNGRSRMSVEMATRLAKGFGTSIELWLNLEHQRTLWMARQTPPRVKVRRILGRGTATAGSQPTACAAG